MHHLNMPEAFPGAGIQGEEAVGEQVGTGAVDSVEIVFGAGGGGIDDAALFVDRELAPDVRAADFFPCFRRPGFVAEFAGMRDSVEGPDDAAGANVEGAEVARRGAVALISGRA